MTKRDDDWIWMPEPLNLDDWVVNDPRYLAALLKWSEWQIGVRLEGLADGRPVITGLRIEPAPWSSTGPEARQLSAERLRTLPWQYLLKFAVLVAKGHSTPEHEMVADLHAVEAASDEFIYGAEHADLLKAARAYRAALAAPELGPIRDQVAESLNISTRTVDRRLNAARRAGILEPYFGNQGKHGKRQEGDLPS